MWRVIWPWNPKKHARHLNSGRVLVFVNTPDRADEAETIMVDHKAYDFSMTNEP